MTDLTEATLESVLNAAEVLKAVRCFIYSSISLKLIYVYYHYRQKLTEHRANREQQREQQIQETRNSPPPA